jgi:putative thiamine transport system permease protein
MGSTVPVTALRKSSAAALLLLAGGPTLAVALLALATLLDGAAWVALWQEPALPGALALSLWTGLVSTLLAWWGAARLLATAFVQRSMQRLLRCLPWMLATPHAAFAIGLVFLLSPSGWVLRAMSPWLTGFDFPPPWTTTQDPWGLGLILALVAKEVPFLLWAAATQLQRDDLRQRWRGELALAQTLGYAPQRAWWRVIWPQLAPRLRWPLLAVLAYGLTVVDMALVIGPASPPTLAVLAWQWLQDADLSVNARGAAAGGLLAGVLLLAAVALWGWGFLSSGKARTDGQRGTHRPERSTTGIRAEWGLWLIASLYLGVLAALAVGSVSGLWPFPLLWPDVLSFQAWGSVWASRHTVGITLMLATVSALLALAWSVAWLEWSPPHWDRALRPWLYLSLVLPGILWVVGLYRVALWAEVEGQWTGMLASHTAMALPYVLLTLSPAYLGVDPRLASVSASLGHGPLAFLWRIKWPLLRRSLAASAAVGFAVSVAQYLPTLYVGAGRFSTVTTEAVTLASGAQRSLTSAYAALQFLLPVLAFALAAWVGRPRRFTVGTP